MAGNAGIQAATVAVQGISTGTLTFGDLGWRLGKELLAAFANGVIAATVLVALVLGIAQIAPFDAPVKLALTAGLALLTLVMLAVGVGATIPLVLDRVGIDPAMATGVFITTGNDIMAVAVLFLMLTLVLSIAAVERARETPGPLRRPSTLGIPALVPKPKASETGKTQANTLDNTARRRSLSLSAQERSVRVWGRRDIRPVCRENPIEALWVTVRDGDVIVHERSPADALVPLQLGDRHQKQLGCRPHLGVLRLVVVNHQLAVKDLRAF
jgi:hypothetical protein